MAVIFTLPCASLEASDHINGIIACRSSELGAKNAEEWAKKLADNAGTGVEWYIMSLHQLDGEKYDFSEYALSLAKYLSEKNVSGTEGIRCALGFIAANCESIYIDYAAERFIGSQGIMSYIWGLHLLNNGAKSSVYTCESLAEEITKMRLSDGGFALSGENGNADVTAMAICALAPYYENMESVKETIDGAISFLSSSQGENGGFFNYGVENCESSAQVVTALCALGIDPQMDERFIKNGVSVFDAMCAYALESGEFEHTKGAGANNLATQQALYAFISVERLHDGKGSFFIFDEQADATPKGFKDVVFEKNVTADEVDEERADIKTTVCVTIIALCAIGIAITVFFPKKKKEDI